MNQQGAPEDWWQKLYDEPPAEPDPTPAAPPDPSDTLDARFTSASVVTNPEPPPDPRSGTLPAQRTYGYGTDTAPPERGGGAPDPGARPGPDGGTTRATGTRLPHEPGATAADVPPTPDGGTSRATGTRPHQSPDPQPTGTPPAPDHGVPAVGEATGYALGAVEVPPAPPTPPPGPTAPQAPPAPPAPAPPPLPPEWTPGQAAPAPPVTPPAPARPPAEPAPLPEQWTESLVSPEPGGGPWPEPRPDARHLGDRAPTYAAEPGKLAEADPAELTALVSDTVLEGARYGTYTLRAASVRGDSARYRGEPRRDVLLTARFGGGDDALILVAVAGADRAVPREAAAEVCRWVASAVGRSRTRLADDIRAGRRDALRSGLQRLTDRGYGRLRARATELGYTEDQYTAGLRCLLLPIDPECRTRVCFGAGPGGLFRLRAGAWQDLEPAPQPGFTFRASVARAGDTLLVCSGGLAGPMREEPLLPAELSARWAPPEPPGLACFLADTSLRLKGYADDRTAAGVWED
ncbi:hypothetical protein [Streptomyces sp. NPDC090022]|uniref:hypothetical protein n=1 Tax=Streptomyces sp. NPDC090022 TaxID=3365920 RepID=UPI003813AC61